MQTIDVKQNTSTGIQSKQFPIYGNLCVRVLVITWNVSGPFY